MNNAHTPGPWELEEVVNDSGNIKHLVPVACIDGELTSLLTTVEHNGANFATVYADARLMVEAPALLKSLKDLLAAVNVRIDDPRIALFDAARALVAKVDPDAPLSSAWCASVDAELAATAEADAQSSTLSSLALAVIGRSHFGNPIPQEWYAAAKELLAVAATAKVQRGPDAARLFDTANRLVTHADYKLGGILSADSKARDIPSNACSQVKARHLAALRDAVNEFGEANQGHASTLPATAVAEGAQLDGESLEQAS